MGALTASVEEGIINHPHAAAAGAGKCLAVSRSEYSCAV